MDASTREQRLADLQRRRVAVIGGGAIGSWVACWLKSAGFATVAVWDDDTVALKNLAAGAFTRADVGKRKAHVHTEHGTGRRWDGDHLWSCAVLVCADHGPTRRQAAHFAQDAGVPFFCAKANGSMWQVWSVSHDDPDELAEFCAFDEAAEADPVRTPCGEPSVGRVASVGAAAEMLTAWLGFDVTPEEVEASLGVAFDPGLAHALAAGWQREQWAAEQDAEVKAEEARKLAIEVARENSDRLALDRLGELREARAKRKHRRRATALEVGRVRLDDGHPMSTAATTAVRQSFGVARGLLDALKRAEAGIEVAEVANYMPGTIEIMELIA